MVGVTTVRAKRYPLEPSECRGRGARCQVLDAVVEYSGVRETITVPAARQPPPGAERLRTSRCESPARRRARWFSSLGNVVERLRPAKMRRAVVNVVLSRSGCEHDRHHTFPPSITRVPARTSDDVPALIDAIAPEYSWSIPCSASSVAVSRRYDSVRVDSARRGRM